MLGDVVAPLLTSFDFFARRVYKVDDKGCDAKDEYEYNLCGEEIIRGTLVLAT